MHNTIDRMWSTLLAIDVRYLVRGFLSMGTSQFVGLATGIVTSYFFANYLEKGLYGNYQFVLTTLGVMGVFTLQGVGKQIIRAYVYDGSVILIPKTIQFFLYALPVSGIGLAFACYFFIKNNEQLAVALVVASLAFPFLHSLLLYVSLLLAKQQFKKMAIAASIQSIVTALCLVLGLLSGVGYIELVAIYCCTQVSVLAMLYAYTVYSENVPLHEKAKVTAAELHLSIGQSIHQLGKLADSLIVFSMLGTTALASYAIAQLPIRELMRIPLMLRTLVLPKFSNYTYEQVRVKALEKTFLLFVALSVLTLLYIVLIPHVFRLIFPLYSESIFYTQLLGLLLPLASSSVLAEMLTIFDKTRELYITNMSFSVSVVVFCVIGAMYWGVTGIICGKLIAGLVRSVLLIFYSSQYNN